MKVVLILSFFSLPFCTFSQYFAPEGSKWYSVGYDSFSGQPGNPIYCNYNWQTQVTGDTIYNGDTLQVLYHEAVSDCSNSPGSNTDIFTAYLKLDSNRVYFGTDISWLTLLYDFNLAVGDTVHQKYYHYLFSPFIDTVVVTSVDSVTYGGTLRKRISFENFELPNNDTAPGMVWVEGIGDINYGVNVINYSFHPDITLDCFISGQETLIGHCYLQSDEIYESGVDMAVYPNPFSNYIHVQVPSEENIDVTVHDLNGKIVYQEQKVLPTTNIDLSFLEPGVYFLNISTGTYHEAKRVVKIN